MLNEQLSDQIEQEAEANTIQFKDVNDYDAGRIGGYKEGYEAAGVHYAALWQAAEERAERAEKLIEQLNNLTFIKGVPGATWGDTGYDSMSAVAGYNQAMSNIKSVIYNAITPKTSDDGR